MQINNINIISKNIILNSANGGNYFTSVPFVVGIGDSITAGFAASDPSLAWLRLVTDYVNSTGNVAVEVNGGVAGNTSPLIVRRLMITERRGVICLLPTVNDARTTGYLITENFVNNLHALIRYYDPISQIIAVGSLPYVTDYGTGNSAAYEAMLATIPSIISQYPLVIYAPVHEMMNHDAGLLFDGVHPNDAGHQVIANAFWYAIRQYFIGTKIFTSRPVNLQPILPIANYEMDTDLTQPYSNYQCSMAIDATQHLSDTRTSAKITVTAGVFGTFFNMGSIPGERPGWGPNANTHCQVWVKADATTPAVNVALQTQQYDAAHNLIAGTTVSTADYPVTNLAWTLMETDIVTHANCRGLQLGALVRGLNNIVYVGRMKAYATANVAWII